MASIKCGNCHETHETVAEVRACYGDPVPSLGAGTTAEHPMTYKQRNYIETLQASLGLPLIPEDATLTKEQASVLISDLKERAQTETPVSGIQRALPDGPPVTPADYPDVPSGYYAVPSLTGNNDLDFFKVDSYTEGRWAGYIFIKRVIGGNTDVSVAKSQRRTIMDAIRSAGPRQAMEKYGQELGHCGMCGLTLTDDTSRAIGIGPTCRNK